MKHKLFMFLLTGAVLAGLCASGSAAVLNYKHKFSFEAPAGWIVLSEQTDGEKLFDIIKLFLPANQAEITRSNMKRYIAGRITLHRIRRDRNDLFDHARTVLKDIKNKGFKLEESRINRSAHIAHIYYRFTMTPINRSQRTVTMSVRLFQSGFWYYSFSAAGRSDSFFKVAEAAFNALKFDPKMKPPGETMRTVSTNL